MECTRDVPIHYCYIRGGCVRPSPCYILTWVVATTRVHDSLALDTKWQAFVSSINLHWKRWSQKNSSEGLSAGSETDLKSGSSRSSESNGGKQKRAWHKSTVWKPQPPATQIWTCLRNGMCSIFFPQWVKAFLYKTATRSIPNISSEVAFLFSGYRLVAALTTWPA